MFFGDFKEALEIGVEMYDRVKCSILFVNPTYEREYILTKSDVDNQTDAYNEFIYDATAKCARDIRIKQYK